MSEGSLISHEFLGLPVSEASLLVVWGHGWGHARSAFSPFLQPFLGKAAHLVLDFPGFGLSPLPPLDWGTAEYADDVAKLIAPYRAGKKLIWVGHSFGGRVGVQLAARHPELVDGLFVIAGAGLQRKRGFFKTLRLRARVLTFKAMKLLLPLWGGDLDALRERFGSADYKSAGALRPIFVRVVREDLTEEAQKVRCPTRLVYGALDQEAPPEFGERFEKLIPQAKLSVLEGQDHYTLLGTGRALVQKRFADFMGAL